MLIDPRALKQSTFGDGTRALWKAPGYLFRHPSLLKYILPAVLVNGLLLALLVYGIYVAVAHFDSTVATWKLHALGHWYAWFVKAVGWLYAVAKTAILVLTVYFVLPPLYVILMNLNPLSAYLASRTFNYVFVQQTGHPLPENEAGGGIGVVHSVLIELRKALSFLLQMIAALCLNVVPYLGSIASAVLCYFINVKTSGWGILTPYYEALGYNYQNQRRAAGRQRKLVWGLGTMFELILLIPVVNLLTLFLGSVAGALVCAEVEDARIHCGSRTAE